MRNKIAGSVEREMNIAGIKFSYHKYYSPENKLEESFMSQGGFKHTVAENKGLFVAFLDNSSKIFAVKFAPGINEFPFLSQISNTIYKNGYVFLGTDTKEQAYFKPVL